MMGNKDYMETAEGIGGMQEPLSPAEGDEGLRWGQALEVAAGLPEDPRGCRDGHMAEALHSLEWEETHEYYMGSLEGMAEKNEAVSPSVRALDMAVGTDDEEWARLLAQADAYGTDGGTDEIGAPEGRERQDDLEKECEEVYRETNGGQALGVLGFFSCFLSWIWPMFVALLLAVFLKQCVILNANVPSGSMENTIMTGDSLIGLRVAYAWSDPERGDIVMFRYPDDESQTYIKRIIGLPGETVVIEDGKVYIDGSDEPLEEDYLPEEWTAGTGPYEFDVPEGYYLVLGDNRNNSWDARYWENTYVERDAILAKALFSYWPLSDASWLGGHNY